MSRDRAPQCERVGVSRPVIGVGLKMYLSPKQTDAWLASVAELGRRHPAIASGAVRLFVLPGFLSLHSALHQLVPAGIEVGAQDLSGADHGPYTGQTSGSDLKEIGCSLVEVGHAERRLLGETAEVTSAKVVAAFRNGLTPVLCVGEAERTTTDAAAHACVQQLESSLGPSRERGLLRPLVVAYEPEWAIGATHAAGAAHVRAVVERLRATIASYPALSGTTVIYGGSAGPGSLTELAGPIDGLFLGRSAHDTSALAAIIDEAWAARGL